MARPKSPTPLSTILGFALSAEEAERLDAHVRALRMRTGEAVTRSSFVRALVLDAIQSTTH